jgi:hypothetical protein
MASFLCTVNEGAVQCYRFEGLELRRRVMVDVISDALSGQVPRGCMSCHPQGISLRIPPAISSKFPAVSRWCADIDAHIRVQFTIKPRKVDKEKLKKSLPNLETY